jgi:hypothetical protein
MNNRIFFSIVSLLCLSARLSAQTVYVDAIKGSAEAKGTIVDPLASLEKAIALAAGFTGDGPVVIKVAPGLYTISHQMDIRTGRGPGDTLPYTVEATFMPDDPDWQPAKMPVIQSVSSNNSVKQFPHCAGFVASKNNVHFKGLKFVGNANPEVAYYYPISRENETLDGLEVSQCYFIGEKNSDPIQGAIWAHGAGTHVDHCIFYDCKNALLLFNSIKDFSVTNSIIYGAYEAAVWFGPFNAPIVFRDNIVTHCNYFWVRAENSQPVYTFSNSLITGNDQYMGYYTNSGLVPAAKNSNVETGVRRSGKVLLSEVKTEGLPQDYLNLSPRSDGKDIPAGIFKNPKK